VNTRDSDPRVSLLRTCLWPIVRHGAASSRGSAIGAALVVPTGAARGQTKRGAERTPPSWVAARYQKLWLRTNAPAAARRGQVAWTSNRVKIEDMDQMRRCRHRSRALQPPPPGVFDGVGASEGGPARPTCMNTTRPNVK